MADRTVVKVDALHTPRGPEGQRHPAVGVAPKGAGHGGRIPDACAAVEATHPTAEARGRDRSPAA